jgi:hypothetical protein
MENTVNDTGGNAFEEECMMKIKKNLQNIAQFKENTENIGPLLKAKFDKKIADLEQKNAALNLQIENLRLARKQMDTTDTTNSLR